MECSERAQNAWHIVACLASARLWLRKVRVDTVPYPTPSHTAALEAASRDSALNTC